ncbi:EamA family transporter RarD [Exiguobacterium sp. s4]|uniref:EamA family transporter RarD n=1 Tax=unclassified Exiguobacterium TaxID=2644629 RepID=UPI001BE85BE4
MNGVNKGVMPTVGAYVMWGVLPIYWKFLQEIPSGQILAHRIVWSFLFILLVLKWTKQWTEFNYALRHRATRNAFMLNGFIVSANWFVYIWAVNHGYIIEASLGYYINPLVSMVLGVLVFRESLNRVQWLAVTVAAIGVLVLTFGYGSFPWIAFILASTFGFYGMVKKRRPLASTVSLGIETLAVVPVAIIFLGWQTSQGGLTMTTEPVIWVALIGTGVMTALPLLLFGYGAQHIPFTLVGFLQFIAPTLSLAIGVILYNEPFTGYHIFAFTCIWIAIFFFSWNSWIQTRKRRQLV